MAHTRFIVEGLTSTLVALSSKKDGRYCFPSQEKLCELLLKYHGVRASRRTLNRVLKEMEGRGYFRRIRRITTGVDGGIRFASTVYVLGRRIFRVAGSLFRHVGHRMGLFCVSEGGAGGGGASGGSKELGVFEARRKIKELASTIG